MGKKFNLSEYITDARDSGECYLLDDAVKEFIKKLKEFLNDNEGVLSCYYEIIEKIDELAGNKLI